ncbi:MAG: tripartite tricarboxylate transporter family receptor [Rubritepida sp.]|nr:tripartite tricarboxylate transporter family receptor [Rubritepida sp.]
MLIQRRAVAATILVAPFAAKGQTYPTKPIRVIVPSGPGGITDILARIVAEQLAERLGQPVVVENRPGAGGVIGTEVVARAEPDGHTLLMAFPSHMLNPGLKARLPYDTERSFAPISTVTTVSLVLMVPANLAARTLPELIALARREPLTFASVGAGSLGHLGAELFRSMAGIELTHIPYRSAPEAHTSLLRGDVSMFFDPPVTAAPHIREGKLRGLGVSSRERSGVLPDVPPIADTLPGYEVLGWNGILAPAGTPAPVVERLNREIRAILAQEAIIRRLADLGADPAPSDPDAFAQRIHTDITKWTQVIRASGISPE